MTAKVDVLVACNFSQSYVWWSYVMSTLLEEQRGGEIEILKVDAVGSAVPDQAKNKAVGGELFETPRRAELTDENRNQAVDNFYQRGEADWIMWLDDDTVPPRHFIKHLLELGKPFVGGVYFLGGAPYNPVAYKRKKGGFYSPFYNYPPGALVQVDSIGMGCTLIHRSVYDDILKVFEVWQRPNGSLMAFPKAGHVLDPTAWTPDYTTIINGVLHVPLTKPFEDDNRKFPFYALENGRTEDHHFCEMAEAAGHKPWLDTNIICDHLKLKAVSRSDYLRHLNEKPETLHVGS